MKMHGMLNGDNGTKVPIGSMALFRLLLLQEITNIFKHSIGPKNHVLESRSVRIGAQFAFPIQDVPDASLQETVYYLDYQGVRFISLDSNTAQKASAMGREVLENNPHPWTIVTFHHPVFSPASDRDNTELRELWKPLFDEFQVDLVLSGHDHIYARIGEVDQAKVFNVPSGHQQFLRS